MSRIEPQKTNRILQIKVILFNQLNEARVFLAL
jgi:hypothetical protein